MNKGIFFIMIALIATTLFCSGYYFGNQSLYFHIYDGKKFPFHGSYPSTGIPLMELKLNERLIKKKEYNRLIAYDMRFVDLFFEHMEIIKGLSRGKNRQIIEDFYAEISQYRGDVKTWRQTVDYYGKLGLQELLIDDNK